LIVCFSLKTSLEAILVIDSFFFKTSLEAILINVFLTYLARQKNYLDREAKAIFFKKQSSAKRT
jgi:hypothetical protein